MKINLDSTKRINEKDFPSTAIIQLFKIVEILPLNDDSDRVSFNYPTSYIIIKQFSVYKLFLKQQLRC